LWLGITSLKGSGYCYESNDNSVSIANSMWHPNDGKDSTHHCVVQQEIGQNWWDRSCTSTYASICQIMSSNQCQTSGLYQHMKDLKLTIEEASQQAQGKS
jgi:hypothetical protein